MLTRAAKRSSAESVSVAAGGEAAKAKGTGLQRVFQPRGGTALGWLKSTTMAGAANLPAVTEARGMAVALGAPVPQRAQPAAQIGAGRDGLHPLGEAAETPPRDCC